MVKLIPGVCVSSQPMVKLKSVNVAKRFGERDILMSIDMTVKMGQKCFNGIKELDMGLRTDEKQILAICEYVDLRLDCADFRMVSLIRTIYSYKDLLSEKTAARIKETILNFKYWMDEPGTDSMCYWSENHQLLFAAVEYLAGQLYLEELFSNSGMTGREHLEKAAKRLSRWLGYRFEYGFTEWHSNTYYEEDISPLSVLIDFAGEEEIVVKSKMILDLLLLDMATHSYKGLFAAASGRCYEKQKKNPLEQDTLEISEYIWNFRNIQKFDFSRISSNFILMKNYEIPEVIRLIGYDEEEVEIKDSMGLDLKEIRNEFSDLKDIDTTGMFLWAMESFTNPESVDMALKIFNAWKLDKNNFLKDLKVINNPLLIKSGLLPLTVKVLNPVTQGVAIQRANTYTYKTRNYMLSTVQSHHPGEFGDQQHIWQATLSDEVTVFTTHPAGAFFEDNDRNFSPGYWVGNGILPHSAQARNVNMSIYDLSGRKGFMEKSRLEYTHAYFPQHKFHEVLIQKNRVFGRLNDTYIALTGRNALKVNESDKSEIIQDGKVTYWICEMGTKGEYESFKAFCDVMGNRKITFKNGNLEYCSKDKLCLSYKKSFQINDEIIDTEYDRVESPYVNAARKPKELLIKYKDKTLYLNFEKMIRNMDEAGHDCCL